MIAHDRWFREQVAEILGMPALHAELPRLFELAHFESDDLVRKAEALRALVEAHLVT